MTAIPTFKPLQQAVILAGGVGSRLRPYTNDRPKPMVLIHGRPYLEYLVEYLRDQGIQEVVLLIGYLGHKIVEYFGNGKKLGIKITYSVGDIGEEEFTGSRIRGAARLLDDVFLLLYCDNVCPLILSELKENYDRLGKLVTTTVYKNLDGLAEYGHENNIFVGPDSLVRFYDKSRKNPDLNGVDMGFFIVSRETVRLMPDHNFSFETELLPRLIELHELGAFMNERRYYYLTSETTMQTVSNFLLPQRVVFVDQSIIAEHGNEAPLRELAVHGYRPVAVSEASPATFVQLAKEQHINLLKADFLTLKTEHADLMTPAGIRTHTLPRGMFMLDAIKTYLA